MILPIVVQVRLDTVQLLGPAWCDAQRDYLVEDEQDAKVIGQPPQPAQELRLGRNHATSTDDRLDNHRCDLFAMTRQDVLHTGGVIEREDDGFGHYRGRGANGIRNSHGRIGRTSPLQ